MKFWSAFRGNSLPPLEEQPHFAVLAILLHFPQSTPGPVLPGNDPGIQKANERRTKRLVQGVIVIAVD